MNGNSIINDYDDDSKPPDNNYTLVRKRFSPEEDKKLKILVETYDKGHWNEVARQMPGRTARQCRDRYNNYLYKELTNNPWTEEEDQKILTLHKKIGPKWTDIAQSLAGRSGNNVKNRWYKYLVKRLHGHKTKPKPEATKQPLDPNVIWEMLSYEAQNNSDLQSFGLF